MHVFNDVTTCECSFPELVLTIGSFDGFHRGHQYIVEEVNRIARERNGTSGLMSLWPHPKCFFNPQLKPELLSSQDEKKALLSAAGLDAYFVLPFNNAIAEMDRETFLRDIILGRCGARCLVVGHDFSFGAGARGDYAYLCSVAGPLGLDVVQLPPLLQEHERISSTLIRSLVAAGSMEQVRSLLGRPYTLCGPVTRGRGKGKELGFPTANIAPGESLLPAFGIYAARVFWGENEALGAVNIGLAPTIQHASPMIEVHLLDVNADLVGEALRVALHHRLRGEKKFQDLDSLKGAIEKDIVSIRGYFAAQNV